MRPGRVSSSRCSDPSRVFATCPHTLRIREVRRRSSERSPFTHPAGAVHPVVHLVPPLWAHPSKSIACRMSGRGPGISPSHASSRIAQQAAPGGPASQGLSGRATRGSRRDPRLPWGSSAYRRDASGASRHVSARCRHTMRSRKCTRTEVPGGSSTRQAALRRPSFLRSSGSQRTVRRAGLTVSPAEIGRAHV